MDMKRMRSNRLKATIWIAVASASLTFLAVWVRHHKRLSEENDTDYYGQYR